MLSTQSNSSKPVFKYIFKSAARVHHVVVRFWVATSVHFISASRNVCHTLEPATPCCHTFLVWPVSETGPDDLLELACLCPSWNKPMPLHLSLAWETESRPSSLRCWGLGHFGVVRLSPQLHVVAQCGSTKLFAIWGALDRSNNSLPGS